MSTHQPRIAPHVLHELAQASAIEHGVCVRPIAVKRTDTVTGQTATIGIRCGTTRADLCPPCAAENQRTRIQQAKEGWHLTEEPEIPEIERAPAESRRVRSTRRRQDAPDLPSRTVVPTTVGQIYEGNDGRTYRPSTFLTLTMPSYGKVGPDGAPLDPATYDYRRAAWDAMHFAELVDRFWQNLRRACGWNVQYFACVEPQQRLAPHLHAAVRGTMSRKLIRQVVAATYHQVWWPAHDEEIYLRHSPPRWDHAQGGYVDPSTGRLLTSWDAALDAIDDDPDARPAHVVRFGTRGVDVQGVVAGTKRAGGCLNYLVKYLTKSVADCHEPATSSAEAHQRRLAQELQWQPCSPRCSNWLLYGIQPAGAHAEMIPGCCPAKAHKAASLGYAGRRCLVSRRWTGKTLDDHRAERREHVMKMLGAVGIRPEQDTDDQAGDRYQWDPIPLNSREQPNRAELLLKAVNQRRRWRAEYQRACSATADLDPGRVA
jgi:hypothetical protein